MNTKKIINLVCVSFMVLFGAGCANYQLGSTLDPALTDVYVPTVRSKVNQPGIEAAVTSAIMKEIQREGTLRICDKANASTILEIEIIEYAQGTLRYNSDDLKKAAEYTMTIKANVVFRKLSGEPEKAIILKKTYSGEDTFLSGTDTISARQRCLPDASKDLAEQIIDACISVW